MSRKWIALPSGLLVPEPAPEPDYMPGFHCTECKAAVGSHEPHREGCSEPADEEDWSCCEVCG